MIDRYTRPEMGRIWSDQHKLETWLQVEVAATRALARHGIVPEADLKQIEERASFDLEAVRERERDHGP